MQNMSDADREARIQELRRLVKQGEYQIDPQLMAARLVEEHRLERAANEENALSLAASAAPPK